MEIVVALIAGFALVAAGLPAALIERARRENNVDHAKVQDRLDHIDDHLEDIATVVDSVAAALVEHLDDDHTHDDEGS